MSSPKLKEVENKKTAPKYPIEKEPFIEGYDYITVTGARTKPWVVNRAQSWNPAGGHLLRASYGNQYHFVNQSIRQLQLFPKPDLKKYRIQRIHVVFQKVIHLTIEKESMSIQNTIKLGLSMLEMLIS